MKKPPVGGLQYCPPGYRVGGVVGVFGDVLVPVALLPVPVPAAPLVPIEPVVPALPERLPDVLPEVLPVMPLPELPDVPVALLPDVPELFMPAVPDAPRQFSVPLPVPAAPLLLPPELLLVAPVVPEAPEPLPISVVLEPALPDAPDVLWSCWAWLFFDLSDLWVFFDTAFFCGSVSVLWELVD